MPVYECKILCFTYKLINLPREQEKGLEGASVHMGHTGLDVRFKSCMTSVVKN